MIEVQKSKSGKINQETCTKVFKQEESLIPKKYKKQIRFNLRKEAVRNSSGINPLLTRDTQVAKYKMIFNLPR
ncbi:MAG: hypothetical protein ACW97Z_04375 [Candidatus Hodarchaeales archaeon]|jgi:hypothetical protein